MPAYVVMGSTHARHAKSRKGPTVPDVVLGFGFGSSLASAWEDARRRNPALPAFGSPVDAGALPPRTSPVDFGRYVELMAQAAWDESLTSEEALAPIPPRVREDVFAFWRLAASSLECRPAGVRVTSSTFASQLRQAFGAPQRSQVWLFAAPTL